MVVVQKHYGIILDKQIHIINLVRYENTYFNDHPTYARYLPFKDTFHKEVYRLNGTLYVDYTNNNTSWTHFYYPRRHKNIPDNENIYDILHMVYGDGTNTLWDYIRFIQIITPYVMYTNRYDVEYPEFGRYRPFKDIIHQEEWRVNGIRGLDRTNINSSWRNFYDTRRYHYNIPSDENAYNYIQICHDEGGSGILWDYTRFIFITSVVGYTANYGLAIADNCTEWGRYKPFKDTFHYLHQEIWQSRADYTVDYTNSNIYWYYFYYARRHQNIPNDENMYDLFYLHYGAYTNTLWDYIRFIL